MAVLTQWIYSLFKESFSFIRDLRILNVLTWVPKLLSVVWCVESMNCLLCITENQSKIHWQNAEGNMQENSKMSFRIQGTGNTERSKKMQTTMCPNLSSNFFSDFPSNPSIYRWYKLLTRFQAWKPLFRGLFCASRGVCDEILRWRSKFSPFAL